MHRRAVSALTALATFAFPLGAHARWVTLPPPSAAYDHCLALGFVDVNTGFTLGADAAGGTVLLLTTDGAATWNRIALPDVTAIDTVDFADLAHVIVAGKAAVTAPVIARSTTGGGSWITSVVRPHDGSTTGAWHFYEVTSASDTVRFAAGSRVAADGTIETPALVRSMDAGATWTEIPLGFVPPNDSRGALVRVVFTNAANGLVTWDRRGLFRTTDGGDTWTLVQPAQTTVSPRWLQLFADGTGIAFGLQPFRSDMPVAWNTMDDGATWQPIDVLVRSGGAISTQFESVAFRDARHGVASLQFGAQAWVFRTDDGGENFARENLPPGWPANGRTIGCLAAAGDTDMTYGASGGAIPFARTDGPDPYDAGAATTTPDASVRDASDVPTPDATAVSDAGAVADGATVIASDAASASDTGAGGDRHAGCSCRTATGFPRRNARAVLVVAMLAMVTARRRPRPHA